MSTSIFHSPMVEEKRDELDRDLNPIWTHENASVVLTSDISISKITKDNFSSEVYEDKVLP